MPTTFSSSESTSPRRNISPEGRPPVEARPETGGDTEERLGEAQEEQREAGGEQQEHGAPHTLPPTQAPTHPAITTPKSALLQQIEHVLEEDLSDVYFSLSPEEQSRFRAKGEETAKEIETLFQKARATAERVLALLKAWLRVIPGVNRFFIEQESKVKTDKIMRLKGK